MAIQPFKEEDSIIGFIQKEKIVNERGIPISFYDRPFLYDPMRDWSRFQCHKKAAQGIGMSVTMNIKSLYAAKHKGWSLIHAFPTDGDAREFVRTKMNKMLESNQAFTGIQTDNIEMKQVEDRFLYYQGTGSKSGALSKTVDVIIQDEKDRSDQLFLQALESRTINSDFRGVWSLSNPSIDGAGVDADWAQSDKKEWHVTCVNGHEHPLTWPESIDIQGKRFVCRECKTTLSDDDRRHGRWINQDGEVWTGVLNPKYKWSGWHHTLMFAPRISAEYVIEQWNEGKNEEYFNNFILGEPYSPGDTKIEKHFILDSWTPKNIVTGKYFLGVDVGNIRHYVLGSEKGIIQVGTFTGQQKLDELIERYKPFTVIDANPENTMSHHYKDNYPNVYVCHLEGDRKQNTLIRVGENDQRGMLFVDKHRTIDRIVHDLMEGKILFSLPNDQNFRLLVQHYGDLRRVKETNKLGIEHYIWDSLTGDDHLLFATLFYWVSVQLYGGGTGAEFLGTNPIPDAIIRTRDGFKMNLKEYLENQDVWIEHSND